MFVTANYLKLFPDAKCVVGDCLLLYVYDSQSFIGVLLDYWCYTGNKLVTYLMKAPPELIEISFERQFNATDLISCDKGTYFF